MLFCRIPGCPDVVHLRRDNLCRSHYQRLRRYGDPTLGGPRREGVTPTPVQDHDDGTRTCNLCGQRKDLGAFPADKNGTQGRRTHCKLCHTGAQSARYHADPESHREQLRERRRLKGDELRAYDRERYERDKDKRIALATEAGHRRRARLLGLPQDYGITVVALRKRDGDCCHYCKQTMDFTRTAGRGYVRLKATVEHVLPLARGGYHVWENVVLACWQCNLRKNQKTADEWHVA